MAVDAGLDLLHLIPGVGTVGSVAGNVAWATLADTPFRRAVARALGGVYDLDQDNPSAQLAQNKTAAEEEAVRDIMTSPSTYMTYGNATGNENYMHSQKTFSYNTPDRTLTPLPKLTNVYADTDITRSLTPLPKRTSLSPQYEEYKTIAGQGKKKPKQATKTTKKPIKKTTPEKTTNKKKTARVPINARAPKKKSIR